MVDKSPVEGHGYNNILLFFPQYTDNSNKSRQIRKVIQFFYFSFPQESNSTNTIIKDLWISFIFKNCFVPNISVAIYFHLYLQLSIKPAGIARKVKLPLDIVIGTVPISSLQSPRTSYHPLPSTVSDNSCPFPFFENVSDQVCLTDKLSLQHMIPTAPPWEEDDDIPWQS